MEFTKEELLSNIKTVVEDVKVEVNNEIDSRVKSQYAELLTATKKAVKDSNRDMVGINFVRAAKAQLLGLKEAQQGKLKGTLGDYALKYIEDGYSKDTDFVSTVKSLQQGNDGGFLIPEEYSEEFIEYLYNLTVVKAMGAKIVPMPKGQLNVNKLIGTTLAQYIAEGDAADFSDIQIGRIRLVSKKLMSLSAMTNDLIRTNSYAADVVLRDTMVEVMAQKMDSALLYGTGGENEPLGIYNSEGVTKDVATYAAATPTREKLILQMAQLGKANINIGDPSIGWVISWDSWAILANERDAGEGLINRELTDRGTLLGKKVMVSNQVRVSGNTADIFLGKWNDVWVGEEYNVELSVSNEATFTDTNGKTISAFTSDFTLFKTTMKHDMKLARGVSFVIWAFKDKA